MIVGVGLDIEEVSRFETIRVKRPGLIAGVFTLRERELFESDDDPARGYCSAFALKEAAFKALGQGWLESSLFWTDIELLGPQLCGSPEVLLSGAAHQRCKELGIDRVQAVLDSSNAVVVAQIWLLSDDGPASHLD